MTKLSERIVQVEALQYLRNRYRRGARGGKIFAQTEVRTRKEYGGKRADGLIVFRHWWSGVVVVAIEAKSSKTLPSMKPTLKIWRLLWNCIRAGFLIAIWTGAAFVFDKVDDPTAQLLIPLNTFVVGAIMYGILTRNNYAHYDVPVLKQLRQYPGHEQWLAFSKDSLQAISRTKHKNLVKLCKDCGYGMMSVAPNGRIRIEVKAKRYRSWWDNPLSYYATEDEIRKVIN